MAKTPLRSVRVPDDIWHAAQERADAEGQTVTAVIVAALRRYASGRPKPSESGEARHVATQEGGR